MKPSEAITIIEAQAKIAPPEAWTLTGGHFHKDKEWVKSIRCLNKTVSHGYSLVGDFWKTSQELEPGLF